MTDMYTYKEFSKIMNTTIRTLRFYESKGLLKPEIVDHVRCLSDEDLLRFQTIQLLKEANYSLVEIKEILKEHNLQEQIIMQKELLHIQLTNIQSMIDLIDNLEDNEDISPLEVCQAFNTIRNSRNLALQFNDTEHLTYRIDFHHRYTTFEDNFQQWMFKHYTFLPGNRVLEIGCGTGDLWIENKAFIPENIEVILTDISKNMVNTSQSRLRDYSMIKQFEVADVFALPFEDASFDVVIINHVLMYLDDVQGALQEIRRVLKDGGRIYCSTIAREMMKERDALLAKFDSHISYKQSILYDHFGFENGKDLLEKFFQSVKMDDRYEKYTITDVQDYYQFILSANGLGDHLSRLYKRKDEFKAFLQKELERQGQFLLTIHAGMFEARKEGKRDD